MTVKEPRRPTTTGNTNVMERGRGPSEKMVVPTFSGNVEAGGDDLGASARSYLRQVAAWRKMTRLSADQHGLVLYQNLSGKAWIDAERLDVDLLGMDTGAEYFINWIKERYLDVQITQIGRGLSDFFRRLRRRDGQTIREYLSDFDRALARLTECGCVLPDMASAWVFVDRMSLEESAELNLLASVGNEYNLKRLQQAAIVQDRSLRKPWESSTRSTSRDSAAPGRGPRREWWNKKTNTAHLTGHGDNEDDDYPEADPVAENATEDVVPEAVAEEWYETFMTHETAKQKYRDSLRQRGTSTEALREIANDRLAQAKAKSFCAGCKRRGHWHKDSCCPLNQGARKQGEQSGATTSPSQNTTTPTRTSYQCSVVYVTWDLDKPVASTQLLAIADTACSKSVMGAGWLDSYLKETAKIDYKPQFLNVNENFKFGASRVFEASYAVIVTFALKGVVVQAKVAVVHGDVPLLLSRGALAKLGTVLDIAANTADFKFINVKGFPLKITDTGHPAVPFVPIRPPEPLEPRKDWAGEDLMILSSERAYTGVAVLPHAVPAVHSVHVSSTCSKRNSHQLENSQGPEDHLDDNLNSKNPKCDRIFYPKKIGKAILNMLTADMLCTEAFMTWWLQTNVSNDFWVETPNLLVRVHVIPRRHFFTPTGWKDGGRLKNKLLENLGRVRSTTGISCKSHRALVPVHDVWSSHDEDQYPVLWVGRSLFARRPRPMQSLSASPGHVGPGLDWSDSPTSPSNGEQVDLEMEQAGVGERGATSGDRNPPEVDGPRDQERDHGAPSSDLQCGGGHHTQEIGVNDAGRVEDHRRRAQHQPPDACDKGTSDEAHPGCHGGLEPQGDDLRLLSGMDLRGHPGGLPGVGDRRGGALKQCQRGPEDVRQLGKEQGHRSDELRDVRRQLGPGVQRLDPVRAHRERHDELEDGFPRTPRGPVESGDPRLRERENADTGNGVNTEGEGKGAPASSGAYYPDAAETEDPRGDRQHQFHGTRGGRRGPGGDSKARGPLGSTQGPTWDQPGEQVKNDLVFDNVKTGPSREGQGDTARQLPLRDPGLPVPDGRADGGDPQLPVHDPGLPVPDGGADGGDSQLPVHDPGLPVPDGDYSTTYQAASERGPRPLFLEVYAGNGGLSRVMNMFGFETVKIDLPEWDLSRADCRRDLIRFVNQSKPDVIWCSPPQKGDVHNQLGDDDLQVHYNFAKLLYGIQMKRGLLGVIELPKGSSGWDKDKLGDLGGHAIHLDLCAYGAYKTTDAGETLHWKQGTRLQSSLESLQLRLGRRCPGGHEHVPGRCLLHGQDGKGHLRLYQEKFCYEVGEAISTVIGEMMSNSTPDVKEQNVSHDENQTCEVLARTAIHEKSYNFATLLEIASSLKLGHIAGHRMATSAEAGSPLGIIGGLWVHGGVHGLTKTCSTIPWVIKYINKFARHHGVQGWTSFSLTKNLLTNVHRDPNNLAGYDSVTTSFGNFSGGELWTHDDHQEDNKEAVWRKGLPGTTVTTRERLVAFDSREPHATQPWTGERWCLTWYTSRAVLKTTLEERDELRALGFPMNSLANTKRSADIPPGEFIRWPERRRPRKSTRTQLWKMAKRLSSFATWSILATTTFLDNAMMTAAFDEPAPTIDLMHHNTPVLFEIGGWDQTMEATAKGIEAVEPMVNLDLHDPPTLTRVKDILEELKPRTLWIHGDHFGDPAGLDEVIELQRNIGGNVTVEGRLNGPMWSSNFGTFLYQMPGVATYRSDDLLRAQFGRRDHALCKREDDVVFGSTNADVLLRNYLEGKNDQETSRQIFPVEAEPRGGARQGNESSSSRGASAINFRDPQPRPEVASSLRRLHQNLGHPAVSDLTRHLRLAGAGPEVVAAAKNMTCEVCRRAQQGKSPKPATLPTTTSFNEIIGVDAFTVYDCQGKKLEMFSIYDYGTSYHIVGELPGHSTEAMEQALCDLWTKVFGPPRTILVDLETGLQAGLERYSAWFGTRVRSAAGQAPWQVGAVERHGGVWKHMWKKVVDEHSILKESPGDIKMGITAINAAKNELRRQGGFSPTQAVYGRDPDVPGELLDHRDPQQTDEILTRDQLRAREQVLRQAARIAYHRAQVDSRLRRALLQRSRVSGEDLNPGDVVYFLRKPKNKKDWRWVGPATVVGHEKKNLWVASAGRCHLVAPEHVRKATSEEVGDLFTLRATQDDLQRLLDQEPGDPQAYDYPENAHEDIGENVDEDLVLPPGDDMNKDLLSEVIFEDEEMPMEGERRRGPPGDPPVVLNKRYRTKGPETAFFAKSVRFNLEPEELEPRSTSSRELATIQKGILMNFRDNAEITTEDLDDHCNYAYMVRKATTERGRQKQLEKEIPWSYIPEEQKQAFKEAELQQWMEHVNHDAVQPVSVEESRQILRDKPERVLPSRYAYRDKNWSKRKKDANIGWRPKARLVIGGHLDPDLHLGLQTSAPTVSRQGVLLLLQILASRLDRQWGASAGDITAAFLNGKALQRELYIKQPRTGLGDLHPEQLVRLTKGVFGLVDSPAAWWGEFKGVLGREEFIVNGMRLKFFHCPLDPCIFQLRELNGDNEAHGEPLAYLAVHVDDVLLIGPKDLRRTLQERISALFPVQEWEEGAFDYIGSYIEVTNDEVHVTQTSYTNTRLFEIPIKHGQQGDEPATVEQKADNRSLIGALSWLAGQTRPDLQTGVSMAQQLQRDPTVDDIKFSNQLSKRAQEHDHRGIVIRPVDLRHAVLLAYRDAGWANAPQDCEDPYYALYPEDETAGEIREGPFSTKDRRAKRSNSKIASQLGGLYLLADCEILRGHRKRVSLLDWRSAACDRVCRSTFAAESMGCCGAIENADFIRKFLSTLLTGDLCRREDGRFQVRYLSDCRSLYDHLAREGIPRIPSERRLAIDMAAIRQDLAITGRMCWVPTDQQLADIMTKPQKAGDWWETLVGEIKLPFVESF